MAIELPENVVVSKLDALANWCRKNSLWPMPFATACCGIELMATGASRHDLARFGAEVFRFSPRQCDLMIVAGRVVMKMLPVLQRIWQQMLEPKWCISMGACASTGGVFDTYAVVQGIDRFIPVDMYVPGCPPRPEQLIQAIIDLQDKIEKEGTIRGIETRLPSRQGPKRALIELPVLPYVPGGRGVGTPAIPPAGVAEGAAVPRVAGKAGEAAAPVMSGVFDGGGGPRIAEGAGAAANSLPASAPQQVAGGGT